MDGGGGEGGSGGGHGCGNAWPALWKCMTGGHECRNVYLSLPATRSHMKTIYLVTNILFLVMVYHVVAAAAVHSPLLQVGGVVQYCCIYTIGH